MKKFLLYFHTIKYLKLKQIFFRLYYFFYKPSVSIDIQKINLNKTKSVSPCHFILKEKIYFKNNDAEFLNHAADISNKNIWNDKTLEKLWLYNLHYFDALNAADLDQKKIAYQLLKRCVDENPPFLGIGWEAFPISLRIVNIIKYALSGNNLSEKIIHFLYLQARFLNKKCEHHLLGNHLFENYKSLCIAGLFFDTDESQKWFQKGFQGLKKEIKEQILNDGGHFELSTMYHNIILEDLLDLNIIFKFYKKEFIWSGEVEKMLQWLNAMKRSNHEISYFNDAANDIAATPEKIFSQALNLDYKILPEENGIKHFSDSGYIVVKNSRFKLIADVGNIGSDYLPGHGHADVLSFELMIDDIPVFVNLGTSCYGNSDRRLFERGTSAHNTVVINEKNSSEIWSGFRVGKRARIKNINVDEKNNSYFIKASHDGYSRFQKNLYHERAWEISENKITISDYINRSVDNAYIYFHLHPDCKITFDSERKIRIMLKNYDEIQFEIDNKCTIVENFYVSTFGFLYGTRSLKININHLTHKRQIATLLFSNKLCQINEKLTLLAGNVT
ncbi:MAG: hypothetical protein A3E81_01875 [Gammaproteobacteria bacterium RIFCSPHIGHO2_12_FULL_36_30]|nr:MAG: hypothetical protein A3E81_01875 [Gammaproteobacteria bacterium RIFCSPHIGHO2_12_FULL_36_30]